MAAFSSARSQQGTRKNHPEIYSVPLLLLQTQVQILPRGLDSLQAPRQLHPLQASAKGLRTNQLHRHRQLLLLADFLGAPAQLLLREVYSVAVLLQLPNLLRVAYSEVVNLLQVPPFSALRVALHSHKARRQRPRHHLASLQTPGNIYSETRTLLLQPLQPNLTYLCRRLLPRELLQLIHLNLRLQLGPLLAGSSVERQLSQLLQARLPLPLQQLLVLSVVLRLVLAPLQPVCSEISLRRRLGHLLGVYLEEPAAPQLPQAPRVHYLARSLPPATHLELWVQLQRQPAVCLAAMPVLPPQLHPPRQRAPPLVACLATSPLCQQPLPQSRQLRPLQVVSLAATSYPQLRPAQHQSRHRLYLEAAQLHQPPRSLQRPPPHRPVQRLLCPPLQLVDLTEPSLPQTLQARSGTKVKMNPSQRLRLALQVPWEPPRRDLLRKWPGLRTRPWKTL